MIPVVVGSSPIIHPNFVQCTVCGPLAQLVEQETLNLLVVGSNPTRPTISATQASGSGGIAKVAELADALDLGSSGATRAGSSPAFRTTEPTSQGPRPGCRPHSAAQPAGCMAFVGRPARRR